MQMERVPERRIEPPPEEPLIEPRCPVCGASCDTFHITASREIVGCSECLSAVDAWEWVNV